MKSKTIFEKCVEFGFIAPILLAACSDPAMPVPGDKARALRARAAKNISAESFGIVPGGLIDPKSEFVSLLGNGGNATQGQMVKETDIVTNVSTNESCKVKAGTNVSFIALNGSYVRVLAPANCKNSESEVEGFISLDDVQELQADSTTNSSGVIVAQGSVASTLVASSSIPVATAPVIAAPVIAAPVIAAAVTKPAAQMFPGCSKVLLELTGAALGRDHNNLGCNYGRGCYIPGQMFREIEKYKSLFVAIQGNAARWKVSVPNLGETIVDATSYAAGANLFRIRMGDVIKNNNKSGTIETFIVQGFNADGSVAGGECRNSVKLVSPLVLDLRGIGSFQGISLAESLVKFDLRGTGEALQTGWIKPEMGFLVLDKNGNGRVDNGSELFGEAYRLTNGKLASNGYEALADLDSNKDGVINSSDASFGKLSVWVDGNGNGFTEKGELQSLAATKIQKIGLDYSPSIRHGVRSSFDNDVRYEARFWGPTQCGVQGCLSFDVYFATAKSISYNGLLPKKN